MAAQQNVASFNHLNRATENMRARREPWLPGAEGIRAAHHCLTQRIPAAALPVLEKFLLGVLRKDRAGPQDRTFLGDKISGEHSNSSMIESEMVNRSKERRKATPLAGPQRHFLEWPFLRRHLTCFAYSRG